VAVLENPPAAITLPRLREGYYYWTIGAETADGLDISAKAPRSFRVLPMPLLPEAANLRPRDGTVITGADLRRSRSISFSWNSVPGASGYIFAVAHGGGGVVTEHRLEGNSFVLEDLTLLDVGEFLWRVEAVMEAPSGEGGPAEILQRGRTGENRFRLDFALPAVPNLPEPGLLYGRE
jgi:hypothetical protein